MSCMENVFLDRDYVLRCLTEKQIDEIITSGKKGVVSYMIFLETRATEKVGRQIFPGFLEGIRMDQGGKKFWRIMLIQKIETRFQPIEVRVYPEELGVSRRIWDRMPSETAIQAMGELAKKPETGTDEKEGADGQALQPGES